jgi:hypothetical protein
MSSVADPAAWLDLPIGLLYLTFQCHDALDSPQGPESPGIVLGRIKVTEQF